MILYLDASALVKEYLIREPGAEDVRRKRGEASLIGTSMISRAETAAALAKAVRTSTLTADEASLALRNFRGSWTDLVRIQVTESLVARADTLTWDVGLRGFDAIHLASAIVWRENLQEEIVFAAFDLNLWRAAGNLQFIQFPADLPDLISRWKT